MQTLLDSHASDAAKREYRKPELTRRERLTEITEGVRVLITGAVQQQLG